MKGRSTDENPVLRQVDGVKTAHSICPARGQWGACSWLLQLDWWPARLK